MQVAQEDGRTALESCENRCLAVGDCRAEAELSEGGQLLRSAVEMELPRLMAETDELECEDLEDAIDTASPSMPLK